MLRTIICCAFSITSILAWAQHFQTPAYVKANTYSSTNSDAFSFVGNQASLGHLKNFCAAVYSERKFMLADLTTYELAFVLPTSSGNFGLQVNYFGSSSYNQSAVGLAYARNLGKVDVGAQFNYQQVRIPGYGNASAINFEGGAILHVSEQFQTGVHIYNPTRVSLGKNEEEKLPVVYSFGMGYDASEKFFIGTEIEKVEDQPVNVNVGLQYAFDQKLFARAGITSATSSFYFGLGFLWKKLRVDVAASLHPSLGVTPGLLMIYNAPVKK